MENFLIQPNELEAVALASSTEQTRYYLNGVAIESYKDKPEFALIATDGHRLHSVHMQRDTEVADVFILGSADVRKALVLVKSARKEYKYNADRVRVKVTKGDDLKLSVSVGVAVEGETFVSAGSFETKAVDGTFPDIRRAFPAVVAPEDAAASVGFNAQYLADFGEAAKLLGIKCQHIRIDMGAPQAPSIIKAGLEEHNFLGVLMPVRI